MEGKKVRKSSDSRKKSPKHNQMSRPSEKQMQKTMGKYTALQSGKCKYNGWTDEGMARFNELFKMVQADRADL